LNVGMRRAGTECDIGNNETEAIAIGHDKLA
jgi:hypothetical protein